MKRKWYVPVEHIRDSLLVVHVCKGEKLPYRKGIPVKGYVPCKCNAEREHEVTNAKRGINERFLGSTRRIEGGLSMTNYAVPASARSVYHKWSSPDKKAVLGVIRKGKVVPKRPSVAKQKPEQHTTIAPEAPNLGRKWYRKTKLRGMDE